MRQGIYRMFQNNHSLIVVSYNDPHSLFASPPILFNSCFSFLGQDILYYKHLFLSIKNVYSIPPFLIQHSADRFLSHNR